MASNWWGSYEECTQTLEDLVLKRYRAADYIKNHGYMNQDGSDRRLNIIRLTKSIFFARRDVNSRLHANNHKLSR